MLSDLIPKGEYIELLRSKLKLPINESIEASFTIGMYCVGSNSIFNPVITIWTSTGIKALVISNKKNSCTWLIIDHRLHTLETFNKLDNQMIKDRRPMNIWVQVLAASASGEGFDTNEQIPLLRVYQEVQTEHTEPLLLEHV